MRQDWKLLGIAWIVFAIGPVRAEGVSDKGESKEVVAGEAQTENVEAIQAEIQELKNQLKVLNAKISTAKHMYKKDPEVVAAKKAKEEAKKAYEAKLREKVASDPEGASLLQQADAIKEKIKELRKKLPKKVKEKKETKESEGEGAEVEKDQEGEEDEEGKTKEEDPK